MASETQEGILKRFAEAAGQQAGQTGRNVAQLTDAASSPGIQAALSELATEGAATTPAGQNVQGGPATESASSGAGNTVESVVKDVFEGGFGMVPLIGGLLGLFGGGSSSPALLKYEMPSSISFTSADVGDTLTAADYDQTGTPRLYGNGGAGDVDPGSSPAGNGRGSVTQPASTAPQITLSVQAMDAQSFLDRSSDIAQAVRTAMLNMNSINDVVNEL